MSVELIAYQPAAGTLFNTYTTAKSVINPTSLVTLPPNYLYIGKLLRIKVQGGISNVVTSQRTFTFQVMMGSIVVHTSGAITTTTTAHTLIPFDYEVLLRVDSIGSGTNAKFLAQGTSHRPRIPQAQNRRSSVLNTLHISHQMGIKRRVLWCFFMVYCKHRISILIFPSLTFF